jgi:hypothetical protein
MINRALQSIRLVMVVIVALVIVCGVALSALTRDDVDAKRAPELRLMRWQIYARYGRPIEDPWMEAYIRATLPGYKANKHYSDTLLSQEDQQDVALIEHYESLRKYVMEKKTIRFKAPTVANLDQYEPLTGEQWDLMARYQFTAGRTKYPQMCHLYMDNACRGLPSFITTDSALDLFSTVVSDVLMSVEREYLEPALQGLTKAMLQDAVETCSSVGKDSLLEIASLRNVALFGVASRLLGQKCELPETVEQWVSHELQSINRGGRRASAIFPYWLDFSDFELKGAYSRDTELGRFYRATTWYGLAELPLWSEERTLQALLMVEALDRVKVGNLSGYEVWERLHGFASYFTGTTGDHGPGRYRPILKKIFGTVVRRSELADTARIHRFQVDADSSLPLKPTVGVSLGLRGTFRFMPKPETPDHELVVRLARCSESELPEYGSLGVMAGLGSTRAGKILFRTYRFDEKYPEFRDTLKVMQEEFSDLDRKARVSNFPTLWLEALRLVMEPVRDTSIPLSIQSSRWSDKNLNAAIGSWIQLNHAAGLHGGDYKPVARGKILYSKEGYVEPYPQLYHRLAGLVREMRGRLESFDLLSESIASRFQKMEGLLSTLEGISRKELAGSELTAKERDWISSYGFEVAELGGGGMNEEMAVLVDAFRTHKYCLQISVGPPGEILVVVPVEGDNLMMRGAIYSTYERQQERKEKLTDAAWRVLLDTPSLPNLPLWTRTFYSNDFRPDPSQPRLPIPLCQWGE